MVGNMGDKIKSAAKAFLCIPEVEINSIGTHIGRIESVLMGANNVTSKKSNAPSKVTDIKKVN